MPGQFAPDSVSPWPATRELDESVSEGTNGAVVDVEPVELLVDDELVEELLVVDELEDVELDDDVEEPVVVSVTRQQYPVSGALSVERPAYTVRATMRKLAG